VRAILRGATTGGRGVKAYRCPTRGGGWHLTSHPITRRRAA
jgi:hypothetical protein